MSTDKQLTTLRQQARRQHGVVSLRQAREAGLSKHAVRHRVASRAWFPLGPGVYLLADHEETPRARAVAAALSLGDDAVLEGGTAAYLWRLQDVAPAPIRAAVPLARRPRARPGIAVRRRTISAPDRARVDGLPVTTRASTVLDVATLHGLDDAARVADRALLEGKVSLDALREVHTRTAGRVGAVVGGELIALAAGGARSGAERAGHDLLRGAGIRGWSANVEVEVPGYGRAVGDVVFDEEKAILEIDGWAYHRDLRAFLRDGPRQSALVSAGWLVLRTHWYELRDDPDGLLGRLRAALSTRSVSVARTSH